MPDPVPSTAELQPSTTLIDDLAVGLALQSGSYSDDGAVTAAASQPIILTTQSTYDAGQRLNGLVQGPARITAQFNSPFEKWEPLDDDLLATIALDQASRQVDLTNDHGKTDRQLETAR